MAGKVLTLFFTETEQAGISGRIILPGIPA